ncbi:unnamed protein product [Closterium sp. NIES-65]|nr:unnamed protein product [Closterium sp. NIES-65]
MALMNTLRACPPPVMLPPISPSSPTSPPSLRISGRGSASMALMNMLRVPLLPPRASARGAMSGDGEKCARGRGHPGGGMEPGGRMGGQGGRVEGGRGWGRGGRGWLMGGDGGEGEGGGG